MQTLVNIRRGKAYKCEMYSMRFHTFVAFRLQRFVMRSMVCIYAVSKLFVCMVENAYAYAYVTVHTYICMNCSLRQSNENGWNRWE